MIEPKVFGQLNRVKILDPVWLAIFLLNFFFSSRVCWADILQVCLNSFCFKENEFLSNMTFKKRFMHVACDLILKKNTFLFRKKREKFF